jgi:hypothetical protein
VAFPSKPKRPLADNFLPPSCSEAEYDPGSFKCEREEAGLARPHFIRFGEQAVELALRWDERIRNEVGDHGEIGLHLKGQLRFKRTDPPLQ